ncbi:MAG: hypothetical protein IKW36_06100 [Alistipes sp.]|nr:hypothetical protein [Alistipes sp.]
MGYLKIIFYGILAFIERHPVLCLALLALAVFAPFVFKWIGWFILGLLLVFAIVIGIAAWRMRKMRRQMEEQMRQAGGGNPFGGANPFGGGNPFTSGGTSGGATGSPFGATGGMTLEEFVRRMQAEADARQQATQGKVPKSDGNGGGKKSDVDSSDYVEFEEVE